VQAIEIDGNCGTSTYSWASCSGNYTTAWTTASTTSYAYTPLDLLRQVTDAAGNVTTIGYDSLGRKTSMTDPDMGGWGGEGLMGMERRFRAT
jgi:YD repeat-containing protein